MTFDTQIGGIQSERSENRRVLFASHCAPSRRGARLTKLAFGLGLTLTVTKARCLRLGCLSAFYAKRVTGTPSTWRSIAQRLRMLGLVSFKLRSLGDGDFHVQVVLDTPRRCCVDWPTTC